MRTKKDIWKEKNGVLIPKRTHTIRKHTQAHGVTDKLGSAPQPRRKSILYAFSSNYAGECPHDVGGAIEHIDLKACFDVRQEKVRIAFTLHILNQILQSYL